MTDATPAGARAAAPEPTIRALPRRGLLGWWALLCALALLQSPGRVVADTKHDLTENPLGLLARSLTMWSETLPLGQLQNQAYGYLFPQGAFFAAADLLCGGHAPMALVQSAWWALTLCLAFTGFLRLAEAAGIGGAHPGPRILAAALYALSPRMLTTLAAISSEAWPVALAPWIALPLLRVVGAARPVGRAAAARAVGLSALALLGTGAVNAVGTAAACVPAGLILLAPALFGPARRRAWAMLGGWLAACAAVSLWWLGPLLLLGRYSPPFTDYIESSGVTTRWLNLAEALRGTTSWAPFVSVERVGGNALVAEPILVLATTAVAAAGLAGLASASMPRRRLWWAMALLGLVAMSAWTTPFGPLAGPARELLDGPAAALRNLHKLDPVLRIPLLLGLAHLAGRLPWTTATWLRPERHRRAAAAMLLTLAAAGATAPAWSGRLAPGQPFAEVPGHWAAAADWLAAHAAGSRTLVEPAMPFADQRWGFTRDEPLQPLARTPWAVRDAVPLTPPEAIRGLDGVRDALTAGGSATLAATLRAQGVGHVLVRHDGRASTRSGDLRALERTLAASPGIEPVADFAGAEGPAGPAGAGRPGRGAATGGIVIWAVADPGADLLSPRIVDADQVPLVSGGPEALPRLDEVDGDAPVRILAGDGAGTVTDTPARRGRNYGEVVGAVTGILAPGEDPGVANLVPDYPVAGIPLTVTGVGGGRVRASSSADQPYNFGGAQPQHSVNALVDGDPRTWWEPARGTGQAEWVELALPEGAAPASVELTAARVPVRVQVRAGGASTSTALTPGEPTRVQLPGGARPAGAPVVRITATGAPLGFALAEARVRDAAGEDITPVRVPVVPDASERARRWVLGQEIDETVMRRAITLPGDRTLRVDSAACRAGLDDSWTRVDGEPAACGAELELAAGMHRVSSAARWVALTDAGFHAPAAAAQGARPAPPGTELAAAAGARILWRPVSVNAGSRARVGGTVLDPITVNGWQQGWVVPAGVSGTLELDFAPQAAWRGWILGGGALAAVLALVAAGLARRVPGPGNPPAAGPGLAAGPPPAATAALGAVSATLLAGWPGLALTAAIGAAAAALTRYSPRRPTPAGLGAAAAALLAVVGVAAAHRPWPAEGYLAGTWWLQLAALGALALVGVAQCLPRARRAGSSTSA